MPAPSDQTPPAPPAPASGPASSAPPAPPAASTPGEPNAPAPAADAPPSAAPLVVVEQSGPVRTLTLNRPQALNSFTQPMHAELRRALEAAAADRSVRCLVLTGAGRGFCAGQDLADPSMAPGPDGVAAVGDLIERVYKPLALQLRAMPMPVIAAVNGVAAGAGASIAFGCDLVIAARSASFVQAFARIGLIPDAGGTWLLPRLVGRARALGLALTGDKLPAEEAERIGLIWRAVDDDAFAVEVRATAERLSQMPVPALVATRQAIDAALELDFDAALGAEARLQQRLAASADHREGVDAFRARRAPLFQDR